MPKNKPRVVPKNSFQKAVENTPEVATCFQHGLSALGKYSEKIEMVDSKLCDGSLDLDICTVKIYPSENRWDYAISYASKVYFVEIHSAEDSQVRTMLRKLQWLKDWLNQKAPEIQKLKAQQPFFWVQSGRYSITPNSSQARQLARVGLKPISKLRLPPK
jgi:hypothetical protein